MADSASTTKSVQETVKRYDTSWLYQKTNHHSRWERNVKLYNGKRVYESYKGISDTNVPMVFSTVETLTAALAAGRPSTDFTPQDMYQYLMTYYQTGKKPDLKALNAQYDYYWDCDNWDLKTIKTIRNGFIYGTSCEWVYWDGNKPRIINMSVRDAVIDPTINDPMDLIVNPGNHYGGRRYITTIQALKDEKVVDPDTGKLVNRYKNLSAIVPGLSNTSDTERDVKDMSIGSLTKTGDEVEVIEIWDGTTIKSVAQRNVDIESRPNDLGIIPLVIHRFIADESIIYGKSIIDPIAKEVELLNDVTNQSVDAVTDILSPQFELDPMYLEFQPLVNNAPGTVYPFVPGSLRKVDKGVVPASAFNERMNMKNEIREATGADQVVKGVTSDQSATATEIKAQLNQAGQRFELYVRMLEREGFYQRAKIVYLLMLHYQTDRELVPTNSIDGPKFRQFDPEQYDKTYEPKVQLEQTVQGMKMKEQKDATESYSVVIADPTNNLYQAKKILYPKMFDLSEEELDRIIGPEPQASPTPPMVNGMMPGAAPGSPMAMPQAVAPPQAPQEAMV